EIEDDTGLAWLTLNRPEKLNALHVPAVRELREALRRIAASSAKALLLVASGRGFCAGADLNLKAFSDAPTAPAKAPAKPDNSMQEAWNPFIEELRSFPKPTLAVVQGPTAGGGVGVALATDITIAARSAYFVLTFTPTL
ncbi:paaG, partial [Symbiodinium necroappetens]